MGDEEARVCLSQGRLADALSLVQQSVRSQPADPRPRIFLFQLLCVSGQWERAMTQLNVLPELDPDTLLMARAGAAAIQCELLRKEVFKGATAPLIFGEPEEWIGWLVHANHLAATGFGDQASELRQKAFEAAPAVSGTINGQPFDWLADADGRLGPVFEAIIDGRYFWVPMHRVSALEIDPPTDLRDVVWAPAHFHWTNGGAAVGLIPTRYVGSDDPNDPAACLARKTEWVEEPAGLCGRGQRLFATHQSEYPLLETRSIAFNAVETSVSAETEVEHAPEAVHG